MLQRPARGHVHGVAGGDMHLCMQSCTCMQSMTCVQSYVAYRLFYDGDSFLTQMILAIAQYIYVSNGKEKDGGVVGFT